MNYKIAFWISISFIIIVAVFFAIGYVSLKQEEKQLEEEERLTKVCYYKVCVDYPEAYFEDNVCTCYDYDLIGELKVAKTELMEEEG